MTKQFEILEDTYYKFLETRNANDVNSYAFDRALVVKLMEKAKELELDDKYQQYSEIFSNIEETLKTKFGIEFN